MVSVVRDRTFLGYALACGLGMGGTFAYIAGSSFVLQNVYGLSPADLRAGVRPERLRHGHRGPGQRQAGGPLRTVAAADLWSGHHGRPGPMLLTVVMHREPSGCPASSLAVRRHVRVRVRRPELGGAGPAALPAGGGLGLRGSRARSSSCWQPWSRRWPASAAPPTPSPWRSSSPSCPARPWAACWPWPESTLVSHRCRCRCRCRPGRARRWSRPNPGDPSPGGRPESRRGNSLRTRTGHNASVSAEFPVSSSQAAHLSWRPVLRQCQRRSLASLPMSNAVARTAGFGAAGLCGTAIVIGAPHVRFLYHLPTAEAAVETAVTLAGTFVAVVCVRRFQREQRWSDLLVAAAIFLVAIAAPLFGGGGVALGALRRRASGPEARPAAGGGRPRGGERRRRATRPTGADGWSGGPPRLWRPPSARSSAC